MMQDPNSFQLARVPLSASPPDSPSGGPLAAPANLPDVPSSALFNQIQRTALEVLSPNDYHSVGGKRFIKKSGWRVRGSIAWCSVTCTHVVYRYCLAPGHVLRNLS